MKLFQECQKNFAILGINSHQQTTFNKKLWIAHLVNGLGVISSASFLIFKANTFEEYSNSAYIAASTTMSMIIFTNIAFKRKEIFELINNLEEQIEKSE